MITLKQIAALPLRRRSDGELEVLLVTSRDTGRWIIPKGWPMKRLSDHKAAAREAEEEAGVAGEIARKPLGNFKYFKRLERTFELVEVDVYVLKVDKELKNWREDGQRQKQWLPLGKAGKMVVEPGLNHLMQELLKLDRAREKKKTKIPTRLAG